MENTRNGCYEIPSCVVPTTLRRARLARSPGVIWHWTGILAIFVPWVPIYIGIEFLLHLFAVPHPHIGR